MDQIKIYDVAGAAGVSLATVSRVLNHPDKVKEATRNKVLKIINDKGYKPNANARGLASRRSTTVAVVIPEISRASVAEMIQGIDDAAKKYGYTIRLFINKDVENEKNLWGEVIASSVDGILFMNDEMKKEIYQMVEYAPVPVVFVNSLSKKDTIGSVCVDYEECAYSITKKMIEKGNTIVVIEHNLEDVYEVEVGTTVTPSWEAVLSTGEYTYGPATGIVATSWMIEDTYGNSSDTSVGTFNPIVVNAD